MWGRKYLSNFIRLLFPKTFSLVNIVGSRRFEYIYHKWPTFVNMTILPINVLEYVMLEAEQVG